MKKYFNLLLTISALALIFLLNGAHAGTMISSEPSVGHPSLPAPTKVPSLSGRVVETMDSSGYTYVNIESDGENTWVAVPQMKVVVGQDISFQPGMTMSNFKSKTLNRTFKSIVFSGGLAEQSEGASADQSDRGQKAATSIKVEKAAGPDAYTVAEVYEKSTDLEKRDVVIRAKVVKFSPGIMGKNWIHLQDGSGNPSAGTDDLMVTSQDTVTVGDVVTLKGTVYKDRDFGSGYKYAVILEDARLRK